MRGSGLEGADSRGEPDAWYDGYMDAAVGRPKWSLMHHDSAEAAGAALEGGWTPPKGGRTAANLPGGPGTQASPVSTDGGQPNLPDPTGANPTPDMNGAAGGNGNPHDLMALPPVAPLEPMTTKPRQMPEGPQAPGAPLGQPLPGMGDPGAAGSPVPGAPGPSMDFDPASNGSDANSPSPVDGKDNADAGPAPQQMTAHRFVAVLSEVRKDNPSLPFREAKAVAQQAMAYLRAEETDPLAVIEP